MYEVFCAKNLFCINHKQQPPPPATMMINPIAPDIGGSYEAHTPFPPAIGGFMESLWLPLSTGGGRSPPRAWQASLKMRNQTVCLKLSPAQMHTFIFIEHKLNPIWIHHNTLSYQLLFIEHCYLVIMFILNLFWPLQAATDADDVGENSRNVAALAIILALFYPPPTTTGRNTIR